MAHESGQRVVGGTSGAAAPAAGGADPPVGRARAAFVSLDTRTYLHPTSFPLELGGELAELRVAYRTWGNLDPDGGNAVVICHALTGSADADRWWTRMFGAGRAFDPAVDFIVCANILGSCYGTTGPTSIDPATGQPYLGRFPAITIRDMVQAQHVLVAALGVRRIRTVIGGSLGGMQALEWALLHPELVESLILVASTARHSAWAIGLSEAQRQTLFADPRWHDGQYSPDAPPEAGLAAARMQAMLSYRSAPSFEERFGRRAQGEGLFAVESYLRHQGKQLVDRFDPATYVTLTRAMDTHDVGRGRGDLDQVLRSVRQPTLVVSIDSDLLYWPVEQREMARLIPAARFAVLDSPHGHDAFLIDVDRLSDLVAGFRGGEGARPSAGEPLAHRYRERGLSLLVVGKGRVGTELLEQLRVLRPELEQDYDVVLRVVGVADRRGAVLAEEGIDLDGWRERLSAAPEEGPLDARGAAALLDRLSRLPGPVLVDVTADEGMAEVYAQAFGRGIDVVSSNKRPLSAATARLEAVREARRQRGRHWHYDASVGASLPVLGTLRRLIRSGDRVVRVEGSLSGTVGYVAWELQRGTPLSLALRWAMGLGYTEADPRDDLSGVDSARKAVVLARELGGTIDLSEVQVEALVPPQLLVPGGPEALIRALRAHDEAVAARVEALRREGRVLRYLARIAPAGPGGKFTARVGPAAVEADHPAARLTGVEAYVAFTTARHAERPLLVQGSGVGGASTAGALLAEIVRLPVGHAGR
ncbi:MAG TPA: homoserine O-acetyltransferase [Anaeromyxobacter sp.]|nr:homoserine O-acetyltransferase [Anaeromyxobacter sp.]